MCILTDGRDSYLASLVRLCMTWLCQWVQPLCTLWLLHLLGPHASNHAVPPVL